ncbi:unnamed protein product [Paramecium sonneborni]|uniref:Uncharacterized protein n=1 Tax=Paramecium sonneborni TaxID=65129 RepID=A0A8S1KHL4_9CILI|nr:unnamed protein product [Paramecium sonneborni]
MKKIQSQEELILNKCKIQLSQGKRLSSISDEKALKKIFNNNAQEKIDSNFLSVDSQEKPSDRHFYYENDFYEDENKSPKKKVQTQQSNTINSLFQQVSLQESNHNENQDMSDTNHQYEEQNINEIQVVDHL